MSRDGILYDENRESEKIARSFELSDRVDEIGRQDQERLSLSLSDVHRHIVRYEAQLTRHGVLSCPVKSLLEHNFGMHTKTTVIGGRRRYARAPGFRQRIRRIFVIRPLLSAVFYCRANIVGRRRVANKPDFQRRDLHTATLASCNTRFYGVMAFLPTVSTVHDWPAWIRRIFKDRLDNFRPLSVCLIFQSIFRWKRIDGRLRGEEEL